MSGTAVSFEQLLDIAGNRFGAVDAPCPLCSHLRKQAKQRLKVFRVYRDVPDFVRYHCIHCEAKGWASKAGGDTSPPKTAEIERIRADVAVREAAQAKVQRLKALALWRRRLEVAPHTPVYTYLRNARGYAGEIPATIGWLPSGKYPPAMIGAFGIADEIEPGILSIQEHAIRGVHLTSLLPDGSAKAGTDRDKIMIGKSIGSPIVLAPPNDGLGLAITEGIEDSLSVYAATGLGVWAAGSASRMPALAAAIPPYIEVVTIVADADAAGQTNADKLAAALKSHSAEIPNRHALKHWEGSMNAPLDANAIALELGSDALRETIDAAKPIILQKVQRPSLLRVQSAEDFMAHNFPPRDYILDPVLNSQGLLMLAAARGVGKTHVALHMAGAVASGGKFLKWTAHKSRRVTYVDGEMPAADLQARLKALPYKCEGRLSVLSMDDQELGVSLNLSRPEDRFRIEGVLGNTELLILDNRSTLVNSGKENDSESWTAMQDWLLALRRKGVSVILVEHAGRSGDPRGTSKREDVLDTIISLTRPEDYIADQGARFEVHLTKARGVSGEGARPFEAKLEIRDGEALWTTRELQDVEADKIADLTNDGLSVRDIADETGLSKSKVGRIQAKLRAEGKL